MEKSISSIRISSVAHWFAYLFLFSFLVFLIVAVCQLSDLNVITALIFGLVFSSTVAWCMGLVVMNKCNVTEFNKDDVYFMFGLSLFLSCWMAQSFMNCSVITLFLASFVSIIISCILSSNSDEHNWLKEWFGIRN